MEADVEVEEYRERFGAVPLGVWATGRKAPVPQAIILFEDRTGVIKIDSPGGVRTIRFEWREHEPFTLQIRRTDTDAEADEEWLFFVYEFVPAAGSAAMRLVEFGKLTQFPDLFYYGGPAATPEPGDELAALADGPARPEPRDSVHGVVVPAVFCTGLLVGLGLVVMKEQQVALDPEEIIGASFLIFFVICFLIAWATRRRRPKDEHGEPERE